MDKLHRRSFLKKTFAGIALSTVLPVSVKNNLLAKAKPLADNLSGKAYDETDWEFIKQSFSFEPDIYYLNNASLGPSPELVIDATDKFRRTLDAFPSKYMWGGWNNDKEEVRKKAAEILGASPEEIALNHNTTEGMNIIASSIKLEPGDEVILADHEHPSGTIPWIYWKESKGIKLVRPTLPILPKDTGEILDVYKKAVTSRTKVISMCHLVNTNGMILPVKEVSEFAHSRGILVAVDGAQSAGMFRINLNDLGCDYFTASSHKWLFSPKGMGIFYARRESQEHIGPLIVANGYQDKSIRRFENYNTRNLPELLGLGSALDFHNLIGSEKIEKRIFELKKYFRDKLSERDYLVAKTPLPNELSGGITTVEVKGKRVSSVERQLTEKYAINCRPMSSHGLNGLRISLSIFNTFKDVDYLIAALDEINNS
ncbi:aminotransferase class V-fold PLP-dependent enzyme [candidate division KSB1 bacterium]